MPRCEFDHLVVTAPTLASGADFVLHALGVAMGPGGEHPRMGTHNLLLRLGDATFLEVIAPDPDAPRPDRPRWFALDDAASISEPRLAAWVARTDDLRAWPAQALAPLGPIETMTRGSRQWLITIPVDGALPLAGAAPALIEWQLPRRPAAADMPASGCGLSRLVIRHPDAAVVASLLASLGLQDVATVVPCRGPDRPRLCAEIVTPGGARTLASDD